MPSVHSQRVPCVKLSPFDIRSDGATTNPLLYLGHGSVAHQIFQDTRGSWRLSSALRPAISHAFIFFTVVLFPKAATMPTLSLYPATMAIVPSSSAWFPALKTRSFSVSSMSCSPICRICSDPSVRLHLLRSRNARRAPGVSEGGFSMLPFFTYFFRRCLMQLSFFPASLPAGYVRFYPDVPTEIFLALGGVQALEKVGAHNILKQPQCPADRCLRSQWRYHDSCHAKRSQGI